MYMFIQPVDHISHPLGLARARAHARDRDCDREWMRGRLVLEPWQRILAWTRRVPSECCCRDDV
eukprot:COSAG04_NODE_7536_length_1112_cov_1.051333_1_plen_63_part_10